MHDIVRLWKGRYPRIMTYTAGVVDTRRLTCDVEADNVFPEPVGDSSGVEPDRMEAFGPKIDCPPTTDVKTCTPAHRCVRPV